MRCGTAPPAAPTAEAMSNAFILALPIKAAVIRGRFFEAPAGMNVTKVLQLAENKRVMEKVMEKLHMQSRFSCPRVARIAAGLMQTDKHFGFKVGGSNNISEKYRPDAALFWQFIHRRSEAAKRKPRDRPVASAARCGTRGMTSAATSAATSTATSAQEATGETTSAQRNATKEVGPAGGAAVMVVVKKELASPVKLEPSSPVKLERSSPANRVRAHIRIRIRARMLATPRRTNYMGSYLGSTHSRLRRRMWRRA